MIRKAIIKKNINTSDIHHVIGHNGSVFFSLIFRYLLILIVLFLVYLLFNNYIQREYLEWSFAWLWLIFFIKFCIDFLNIYLDALVLTDSGITLYLWEGLLEYKTEMFDRDRIETVSHNQKWIWDKVFMRWDVLIRLEHGIDFPFENISYPKKQAAKILQLKDKFILRSDLKEDALSDNRKFDILVEALGEVVKDYIDKWDSRIWSNNKEDLYNEYDWESKLF